MTRQELNHEMNGPLHKDPDFVPENEGFVTGDDKKRKKAYKNGKICCYLLSEILIPNKFGDI